MNSLKMTSVAIGVTWMVCAAPFLLVASLNPESAGTTIVATLRGFYVDSRTYETSIATELCYVLITFGPLLAVLVWRCVRAGIPRGLVPVVVSTAWASLIWHAIGLLFFGLPE